MTPFLIFMGVPPAYAVANEANNILATSVSGSTTHYLKNTLDYKMGFMIVIGGSIGILSSASIGESMGLFEPIHGSFPQATNKNIANPVAAILSVSMMLNYLNLGKGAKMIEKAVENSLINTTILISCIKYQCN